MAGLVGGFGGGGAVAANSNGMNVIQPNQSGTASTLAVNPAYTMGLQNQQQIANIQAQASEYPAKMAMQRFNQVFPWLQGRFNSMGTNGAGTAGGSQGALGNGNQPRITTNPIWNPQQIQQQINQSNAASDASTQSQQRQLANQLGGSGYGSNSPLAQALSAGMSNANLQNKTQNATNIGMNAAGQNAQYQAGQQQAASQQYAQRQQEVLQQQQIMASQNNALIAALASMSH